MVNYQCSVDLISEEVQKSLPEGYKVRPLEIEDYAKGHLDCLAQLTTVGEIKKEDYEKRFNYLKDRQDTYASIVIEHVESKRVVASGTLIVERKFIHALGLCGHIEDIVVDKSQRGKRLGLYVIETLKHIGKSMGCYKIILDCNDGNIAFYQKCGFEKKENEMVLYFWLNDPIRKQKVFKRSVL